LNQSLLTIDDDVEGDDRVVRLAGVIDVHTADTLSAATSGIEVAEKGRVLVDMAGVEFMDSSGLRVLVGLHQRLDQAGGQLLLRAPQAPVARVLEITGLSDLLLGEEQER
jgi:anti-sigma B factor antagonist